MLNGEHTSPLHAERLMARRSRIKRETSAGGVVFRCTDEGPRYLLILDSYANWGFPKGHIDGNESASDAARREIQEETALEGLMLHAPLGVIDWYFRFRGQLIHKYCHFFLFESSDGVASPQEDEGISACAWYPFDQAQATISYDNARAILDKAAQTAPQLCAGGAATQDA